MAEPVRQTAPGIPVQTEPKPVSKRKEVQPLSPPEAKPFEVKPTGSGYVVEQDGKTAGSIVKLSSGKYVAASGTMVKEVKTKAEAVRAVEEQAGKNGVALENGENAERKTLTSAERREINQRNTVELKKRLLNPTSEAEQKGFEQYPEKVRSSLVQTIEFLKERDPNFEHGAVIGPNGGLMKYSVGTHNSVNLLDQDLTGCYVIHTHPNNTIYGYASPISGQDLYYFAEKNAQEVMTITIMV